MHKIWSKFLSLVISLICSLQIIASDNTQENIINYLQNNFKIKDQIWGIETDPSNGMVYFATNTGLLEFDGLSFNSYASKQTGMVRSICIDNNNVIFTGGFETFGYWLKNADCKLVYYTLSDSIGMNKNDEIWKIYALENEIIFQSFTTIYKYNYKTIDKISAPSFMLFMFKVADELWVQILNKGLYKFKNNNFEWVEGSEQFCNIKIHSIVPYNANELLVCTEKSGIYKFDGKKFTYWNSPISTFLSYKTCNAARQLSDSSFVFGTILDGIVITNYHGHIEEHYNFGNGLGNNTVLSLSKSASGGLWIGLDEGANYINKNSSVDYYSTATGSLGTIYSLIKDENTLYFGSNHGLFKSKITQTGTGLSFSKLQFVPNSQGQVWTLSQFGDEILCGHNEGTFSISEKSFRKISDVTGGWTIKPYGNLLLEGTYTGLISFTKDTSGKWKYNNRLEGFYEPTRHFEIDYLGYIWASHPQKGIYRLKVNESKDSIIQIDSFTNLKKSIGLSDVYKLNNRIVFSAIDEFYTYDYVNDSMIPFDVLNQSLESYKQASQIIPFEKNLYWFVNKNKLALFRISIELEPTKINEYVIADANMPGQDLAIMPLNSNNFLISNRNGLALLKKNINKDLSSTSNIFIKNVFFHGKNKALTFCGCNKLLKVPNFMNNVIFQFSDPSSVDLSTNFYKYRIKEIDENWIYTETPEIRYYHLKPGTYHLEISSDSNTRYLSCVFIIKPPWYITRWAYLAYLFLLAISAYSFYLLFQSKLQKQRKLLEFEVKQTSLENRLQNTNVELMLTLRYLIQKNESLQNLRDEIETVKETPGNIPQRFIKKLDSQISIGLELQTKEWKMALHNLKLSQEGYFKKLKEKFPRLTNNDIRLCSYLRMNFTSKEIAQLLNISTRAVEISRYRLRKKLSLEHDINLTDFLMKDEF
jgi:hypothetical protein